jgi:hypothetical protein
MTIQALAFRAADHMARSARAGQIRSRYRNPSRLAALCAKEAALAQEGNKVKWAGMYLFGFVVLLGGLLAALWKLGLLARVGTTWTLIGCAIAIGLGIMIAVSNSGAKENIEINRK